MGVCCVVFDIDGLLFDFFMNFLNIEKNKILRIFFQYFMFSSLLCYVFPTCKKQNWCKKNIEKVSEGGGGRYLFSRTVTWKNQLI